MTGFARCLMAVLLCAGPAMAQGLPPWLELNASLERAHVPACPRERAQDFRLHWRDGELTGSLAYLGLDLTCSRSGSPGAKGEGEALSLLQTLPSVDFAIDHLILHLPGDVALSGPARLRRSDAGVLVDWHTDGGALELTLIPYEGGWRLQGDLPGRLLLASLNGPVQMEGNWHPGQGLQLMASTALPAPLSGTLRLNGQLATTQAGLQWQSGTRLTITELGWRQLRLHGLTLRPAGPLPLNGIGRWTLGWQGGRWQDQPLPGARLELALTDHRHGDVTLHLASNLQVSGHWRWQQGLALTLPEQRLSLAAVAAWMNGWLALPKVEVDGGELRLSGRAGNLPGAAQRLNLALSDGRLRRGELVARQVEGRLGLAWRQGQVSLTPDSGLAIGELNTGVPVTKIHAALGWRRGELWLSGLTGRVLEGRLALSPMKLSAHTQGELHLQDMSLAQLLSLAAVPGLTGDGKLHGRLPFVVEGRLSVNQGRLWGRDGWVSYQAGESLTTTAEDNLSLGLTLGMLQDLRYHRLDAEVSMTPDGEAVVLTRLQGRAPVMGKMHPVNFNYRHQENLLQLLESLRFAGQLSERLPASLQGETNQ
ncbi:YdbH domain-containing protein [Oceanimonas sp. CHS3-5]|uniref:YdbH domain-containing protein n=1 Tax=Oceanimonas sp. CHS3-5 TaxID=3068186 RepID=UPI00273D9B86|nr:YdbH domain-containing protein [Oceanimonas sp. CHS3-5]MDP5293242.1 YdbH domain-containing protein [Oceanimonas sp. CHS3-5]